jgi:hypothetical protein
MRIWMDGVYDIDVDEVEQRFDIKRLLLFAACRWCTAFYLRDGTCICVSVIAYTVTVPDAYSGIYLSLIF